MKALRKHAVNMECKFTSKEATPSRTSWWLQKTKIPSRKSGVIYRYKCDRVECAEEYIGQSSITFGERFKEHLKAPSPIYDHFNTSGHNITLEDFSKVGREDQNINRLIKESFDADFPFC